MNRLFAALAVTILAAGSATATDKTDAMSVVHQWVEAFNNGDVKSAVVTCADQTSIIDDFPPHEWHGAGACSQWFRDFETMSKSHGTSEHRITVGEPWHIDIVTELAYVVAPATLSYQRSGKPIRDTGILTVTLHNGASGWRITGWVWSDR